MSNPFLSKPPRFRALDGLRGLAACLVVMSHLEWTNHLSNLRLVINGYLAVDLFFIMSGLVIAANYSSSIENAGTALRFMRLRFFRLYPLHLTVLGMFFVLECLKAVAQHALGVSSEHPAFSGGQSFSVLLANLVLIQGLGWVREHGWNGPSWSISCEFFAYAVFALLVPLRAVHRTRAAIAAICCFSAGAYVFLVVTRGNLNVVFDLGILRCFAGFACGVLLWKFRGAADLSRLARSNAFQILVTVILVTVMALAKGPGVLASIPLFAMLILSVKFDEGPIAYLLNARAVQFLGRISYSIYMVHELVVVCVLMVLKRHTVMLLNPILGRETAALNPWLGDALTAAVACAVLALASVTYKFIEEPGRSFGRRVLRAAPASRQVRPARLAQSGEQVTELP